MPAALLTVAYSGPSTEIDEIEMSPVFLKENEPALSTLNIYVFPLFSVELGALSELSVILLATSVTIITLPPEETLGTVITFPPLDCKNNVLFAVLTLTLPVPVVTKPRSSVSAITELNAFNSEDSVNVELFWYPLLVHSFHIKPL
ncbi:MAG: hypothetical protein IJ540_06995 [Prevotella sp.]|nr:hypothetical protein [Prevotella sp.]